MNNVAYRNARVTTIYLKKNFASTPEAPLVSLFDHNPVPSPKYPVFCN